MQKKQDGGICINAEVLQAIRASVQHRTLVETCHVP